MGTRPARVDAAIQADARAERARQARDFARVRQKIVVRVLRVDAALDGGAAPGDLLLRKRKRRARGDLHLQADQVEAR